MPATRSPLPTIETVTLRAGGRADASIRRAVATMGLLGIALIHLLDLPGKMEETPYLGVAFIGLIIASLLLAAVLAVRDDRMALLAAAALAIAVIIGYVLSRTTGLPAATADIGNWTESLGIASLFVGGTVVLVVGAGAVAVNVVAGRYGAGVSLHRCGKRSPGRTTCPSPPVWGRPRNASGPVRRHHDRDDAGRTRPRVRLADRHRPQAAGHAPAAWVGHRRPASCPGRCE